ncbi:MAG: hypothetical protein ACLQEQ_02905 [Nitrososphaerales archaeon]
MGSFFAGIKAGTLGGIVYIGGLTAFNAALLYAFKAETISLFSTNFPNVCPAAGNLNGSSAACFNSVFNLVVTVYLPYIAFLGFFVSLFFAALFGWSYESFPGKSSFTKGEVAAALVAFGLFLGDLFGVLLGSLATVLLAVFFVVWTGLYGFIMGRLYTRYTRLVRFESTNGKLVKVMVDGKDYTGKSRTLAYTSIHKVRADVDEGVSFKQWDVSGGVTVEDPRSFETLMEVNGDGLLKAQGAKK